MKIILNICFVFLFLISFYFFSCQEFESSEQLLFDKLKIDFLGNAQIEVGGPYVGIAMHHGSPLISRISFFYPVANSIDLSNDYWTRDTSQVLYLGLKVGNNPQKWIEQKPFPFEQTPYSIVFQKEIDEITMKISYQFCKNKPAMIAIFELTNTSSEKQNIEFYTHLETSLKTSHTYSLVDKAWTEFQDKGAVIYTNFDDSETGKSQVFIANAGVMPVSWSTNSRNIGRPGSGKNFWINQDIDLSGELMPQDKPDRPAAAYIYKKNLASQQKMEITQIIGSCEQQEGTQMVDSLLNNYQKEINFYEHSILDKAVKNQIMKTGDDTLDHSIRWATAILETNQHFLDGDIVPMPCPAEYNFYFTHDVLLTDLAAVYFDSDRVKNDLELIIKHADSNMVIPHAYYWKDNKYMTEFAGEDNWNHYWFILVCTRYLRHTNDIQMLRILYPYLTKSIELTLRSKQEDDLMWGYRPDWWDIGKNFGPRAYMTILFTRALREYIFISVMLNENIDKLIDYEKISDQMQEQLNRVLWDDDLEYLINYYKDNKKDTHYYIGSLLAAHFNLINQERINALSNSASLKLLDEQLGIYNAFPMDYHHLGDYLIFSGNEAGDQFLYMNGGIWSHGNAWYTLALNKANRKKEAFDFIKKIMTVKGIMNSPNGQPAMYEYRSSDNQNLLRRGKIDKPQFMWAASWYLYSLYDLFGLKENIWNISFDPYIPDEMKEISYISMVNRKPVQVIIDGEGSYISEIKFDGKSSNSLVIPGDIAIENKIKISLGKLKSPYLVATNSILESNEYNITEKTLNLVLKAFTGHLNETEIISPVKPKTIFQNKKDIKSVWSLKEENGIYQISVNFLHVSNIDSIRINFN